MVGVGGQRSHPCVAIMCCWPLPVSSPRVAKPLPDGDESFRGSGGPLEGGGGRACDELLATSRLLEPDGVLTVAGSFFPAVTVGLASGGRVSIIGGLEEAPVAMVQCLEGGQGKGVIVRQMACKGSFLVLGLCRILRGHKLTSSRWRQPISSRQN